MEEAFILVPILGNLPLWKENAVFTFISLKRLNGSFLVQTKIVWVFEGHSATEGENSAMERSLAAQWAGSLTLMFEAESAV